ncbi:hypothetical protein MNBD_GAMMA16-1238, partial [hydrothermal vent metagenome]
MLSNGSFLRSGVFAVGLLFGMNVNAQTSILLSANLATSSNTPESAVAAEMSRICSRLDALGSLTSDQAQLRSACTELGNASN